MHHLFNFSCFRTTSHITQATRTAWACSWHNSETIMQFGKRICSSWMQGQGRKGGYGYSLCWELPAVPGTGLDSKHDIGRHSTIWSLFLHLVRGDFKNKVFSFSFNSLTCLLFPPKLQYFFDQRKFDCFWCPKPQLINITSYFFPIIFKNWKNNKCIFLHLLDIEM